MSGYDRYGRRQNPRGGLKWRLLIAAALVLFAMVSYYSSGQVNPITGENQIVGMNTDQEIAMGLQAAPEMEQHHGGLHPDRQARERVDAVGRRLLTAFEQWLRERDRKNPYEFDFHLLRDEKTVNAFALPGGQVFITAGLYSRLETDGQLAGVLGHEIGHVLSRHGAQRLAKQKLTQDLAGAAGVAGGSADTARMAMAVGQLINMQYGRDDELESDKWGVTLTAEAGYDPRAMFGVMKVLDEASGPGGPPEMLSTHPKPANRKIYVERILAEMFPGGVPEGLEP